MPETRTYVRSPLAWRGPAIGLLDLDAFFASVEQLDHPAWRVKPVIVGGSADKRGVVSTASYEARRFGVHSAMPSFQAQRLCPEAIWTRGHFARYRQVSDQVMACIQQETPLVEQMSIDEAFFDITPGRYSHESPLEICRRIQRRVDALGVSCSIGLGGNKTVAKIASDRDKPHGLTVVMPGTEQSFLAPLPVRAMSGIGSATEAKLLTMGIRTLGQLGRQDPEFMQRVFGIAGPRMVERAAGREKSQVLPLDAPEEVKSVSNERTFSHDLLTREELEAAIDHVSGLVGSRLRRKELKGSEVTLKLKYDIHHTRTAQKPLDEPSDDEHVFGAVARALLDQLWHEGMAVRLVGVAISDFGPPRSRQLSLFDAQDREGSPALNKDKASRDLRKLSVATDQIRERFGADALSYGRDLRFRDEESDTVPKNKSDF